MKILAFEFSSSQRSVAVACSHGPGPGPDIFEVVETGALSTRPIEMITEVLRQAQLEREQIDVLAVGLGPGSYTGIRTAIALAQGWQLGTEVKLIGISSADCIAAQARAEGFSGRVLVAVDAQRQEFYLAAYEIDAAGCRETEPLRLASRIQVEERRQGEPLLGPDLGASFPESRAVFPRAATLARLCSNRADFVPGENLEPIYLRETTFVKAPPPRYPAEI